MKKRVLGLILVLALLPVTAMAAEITVSEAIPYKYDDARDFSEGLASVKLNDKWGYIGKTGREVIPCKYESAWSFSEGLAPVELNGKWGFIDKTGKEVIPCKYDQVRDFSEGLAVVYLSDKRGYIDKTGREVVPLGKYDGTQKFSEGLAEVWTNKGLYNNQVGFIDTTGKEVIPLKYGHAFPFSEGLAAVRGLADKSWKWGFIDKTGKEIIPHKYEMVVDGFSEGFAKVAETSSGKSQWGYIDKTGKEVIPCKYDQVRDFSEGLAAVCDGQWPNKKWGFIDKTGKVVIPFQYDGVSLSGFSEGLAMVQGENGKGFIDKTGREVVPLGKYNDVRDFSEGLAMVRLNSKWGFLAIDGYVPLELDQGNGVDYIIADSSSILNVPTNPIKPGYTFGGWYTDAALTTPWNFNDKVVNTLTLYAKWVPVSSTATKTGKSQSIISLNGNAITLDAYTLKAANGGDVTYVKLRDIAALLESTSAKFNVDWKRGAIYVASKSPYTTKNGTELKAISGTDGSYKWNQAPVLFDGTTKPLEGIVITDGKGGGHTFFKLRDLGEAIGFTVGWTAQRGIFIETK